MKDSPLYSLFPWKSFSCAAIKALSFTRQRNERYYKVSTCIEKYVRLQIVQQDNNTLSRYLYFCSEKITNIIYGPFRVSCRSSASWVRVTSSTNKVLIRYLVYVLSAHFPDFLGSKEPQVLNITCFREMLTFTSIFGLFLVNARTKNFHFP